MTDVQETVILILVEADEMKTGLYPFFGGAAMANDEFSRVCADVESYLLNSHYSYLIVHIIVFS